MNIQEKLGYATSSLSNLLSVETNGLNKDDDEDQ